MSIPLQKRFEVRYWPKNALQYGSAAFYTHEEARNYYLACEHSLRKEIWENGTVTLAKQYEKTTTLLGTRINYFDDGRTGQFFYDDEKDHWINLKGIHSMCNRTKKAEIEKQEENHEGMIYNEYTETWSWF